MSDPNALLTTLAQSSAAVVAIVGGFLVSRLVALSSEREGLRRQLTSTRDRLGHVIRDFDEAHAYRLHNSQYDFFGWVIEDAVEQRAGLDIDATLEDNIPRGSSEEEMRPYLLELLTRVEAADPEVRAYLDNADDARLELGDLESRGLKVPDSERRVYEHVLDRIAKDELPQPRRSPSELAVPFLRSSALIAGDAGTASRRLDESIAAEQDLRSQQAMLESDLRRLGTELQSLGRPSGVVAAIWILAGYSLLGIVLPVLVIAAAPKSLSDAAVVSLVGAFIVGLFAVLGYILWYFKTLDDPVEDLT